MHSETRLDRPAHKSQYKTNERIDQFVFVVKKTPHFLNVHLIIANHLAATKHQRNKLDLDHISAAEVSLF